MNSMIRQLGLLCLGAFAVALTACASNDVTLCEKANILCPANTHCAGLEAVCIPNSNLCGDGVKDPGEVCDDGNTHNEDDCSDDCKSDLSCGNGITDVHAKVPEQCDDGKDRNGKIGSSCSATCQFVKCGNGGVEQGELCDDSNITPGDGCSATCQSEFCGNEVIDPGEVCDHGKKNGTPGDSCSANCRSNLTCKNGIVDPGEECDHGEFGAGNPTGNDNSNDCRADCQFNQCGDGFTDTQIGQRHEQCDAGHLTTDSRNQLIPVPTETAGCNIDCSLPSCGDGKVNRHFTPMGRSVPAHCDSATNNGLNQNNDSSVCTSTCQLNKCGDGHMFQGVEGCDDGGVNTARCNANCTVPACGDGIVNAQFKPDGTHGEQCDNGFVNGVNQNQDTAACTAACQVNVCGDSHVLAGIEACDSGGVDAVDCDPDCTVPVCGDGHVNHAAHEACDDGDKNGKATSPNGCNQFCQFNKCGDGILDPGEQCDDGTIGGVNQNHAGARCNAACKLNVCGDGDTLAGVEVCDPGHDDQGNPKDTPTCDRDCTVPVCGDGVPNTLAGEQCDEGPLNGQPGHCNARCKSPLCGNGVIDVNVAPLPDEECDDGASGVPKASARCNIDCTLARCGDGKVNPLFKPDGTHIETCDKIDLVTGASLNGVPCDYGDPFCTRCNATCTGNINPGGPFCGDGIQQTREGCDPTTGPDPTQPSMLARADAAACDNDCTLVTCGDGHLNALALEKCDDGNTLACGTCASVTTTDCRISRGR